ncbi:unnamed protein product, partial [Adineta steineri]
NDNVTFGNSVIMEKFPTMTLDKLEEDLTRYATGDHAGVSTASCGDWTNIDSGSSKPVISFSPIATNVHYTTPNKR